MRKTLLYIIAVISIISAFGGGVDAKDIVAAIYISACFILSAIDNK